VNNPIPTTPPSGFRDHLPDACARRARAIETISSVYRSFGFQQIATSAVEDLAVLLGKGGGENEKLIFKIMKRGEKLDAAKAAGEELADAGLRFDLTLPLARFYDKHGSTLPHPLKAFNIGPVWRAERAQKGRYREFYQCDVDVIGSEDVGAEIDVISAILAAFDALGVPGVQVVLNDRSYVYEALAHAGVPEDKRQAACVIIDKLDKVERPKIIQELSETIGSPSTAQLELTLLRNEPRRDIFTASGDLVGQKQFAKLDAVVAAVGAERARVDPSLMRGFDYYTGPVFEFRHPGFSGSIGGGGRYDHLTEKFGTRQVPACGGSIGFERLLLILEGEGAQAEAGADVCMLVFSEETRGKALEAARFLRARGVSVDVFPGSGKLKNQFKYADQKRAAWAALIGPDEAASHVIKLKNLKTGQEILKPIEEAANLFGAERANSPV